MWLICILLQKFGFTVEYLSDQNLLLHIFQLRVLITKSLFFKFQNILIAKSMTMNKKENSEGLQSSTQVFNMRTNYRMLNLIN